MGMGHNMLIYEAPKDKYLQEAATRHEVAEDRGDYEANILTRTQSSAAPGGPDIWTLAEDVGMLTLSQSLNTPGPSVLTALTRSLTSAPGGGLSGDQEPRQGLGSSTSGGTLAFLMSPWPS